MICCKEIITSSPPVLATSMCTFFPFSFFFFLCATTFLELLTFQLFIYAALMIYEISIIMLSTFYYLRRKAETESTSHDEVNIPIATNLYSLIISVAVPAFVPLDIEVLRHAIYTLRSNHKVPEVLFELHL